jgi:hypothetical protein
MLTSTERASAGGRQAKKPVPDAVSVWDATLMRIFARIVVVAL